jgi:hypothetical protein
MANLSSFYPQPVVAGTTEGTFAEGNDPRFGDGLEEAPEDGVIYGRKDADWVDITEPANLQVRRGTAAEVAAITPLVGEPVWETDTKKLKVGDGIVLGGVTVGKFPLDGTLRNPTGYGSARPSPGSVFISSEVETVGGVFLGGPYVTGNARGFGAVDLQGERTAATQVASGNLSFIASSARSTTSATSSSVIASASTVCSGQYSLAVGCLTKTISGKNSFSLNSNISEDNCAAFNGVADRRGMFAHGADNNNVTGFDKNKRVQSIELILKQRTTNATPSYLVLDSTGGIELFFTVPSNIAIFGTIDICAIQESTGVEAAHYIRKFGIRNIGGTTELMGSVTTIGTDYESSAGLDVSITADNTNDLLSIFVTGLASTNLRWVGVVRATEVEIS